MKLRSRKEGLNTIPMTSICLLGIVLASSPAWAQGAPEQKPLLSEQAFKNVQLLRGIPVDEFMQTMGFISASTGMNCIDCHTQESGGDWTKYADDTALKQTTRRMILMVSAINQANFAGKREVTCWSCHRGGDRPQVIPRLAVQYTYVEEVPDEILQQAPRVPSADQILDKYIQALGGAQSVAALTSFAGKGTYEGYDTGHDEVPVEVFGKAPGQRATIIHTRDGDSTLAYDGSNAWIAAPEEMKPLPLIALTGGELEGARIEAQMFFPSGIKQFLQEWRVGPAFMIEDRQTDVVQGKMKPGGLPVKLYFDRQTNLLLRLERYTDSPLGIVPTQIDYSDYRVVSGVKIPFHLVTTWTDGQSSIALRELKTNVPIDAAKFAKPTLSRGPTGR